MLRWFKFRFGSGDSQRLPLNRTVGSFYTVTGTYCGGSGVARQTGDNIGCHILVVLNIHCTFAQQPLLRREVLTVHKGSFREGSVSARNNLRTVSDPPNWNFHPSSLAFRKVRTLGKHLAYFCAASCLLGPGIVLRTRVVSYPARAWLFSENGVTVRAGCATVENALVPSAFIRVGVDLDSSRPPASTEQDCGPA
ncbi:hypothetical protein E1301_Tti003578 [Triplophysa tibetana]|uniref:Uncharacterized protein n=1 Tax=Triplophysa tibetana TaxID=1572043 RepID=A0A5A9PQ63_9TELE|nr:hypothetical protein E1301_Tti003578 [Triplophysa tibetana]